MLVTYHWDEERNPVVNDPATEYRFGFEFGSVFKCVLFFVDKASDIEAPQKTLTFIGDVLDSGGGMEVTENG